MTPKEQAEFDQNQASLMAVLPSMIWQFFNKLKEEGFNESQALILASTYLQNILNGPK